MPDIVLGGAFVDVTLRPKNIEKDADRITRMAGKKIESFFDKYSKESFFEKYSRKSEEAKLDFFLPSDQTLATAINTKMAKASGGIKGGNVRAMMGAQLTYALQDALTGASMGNMNQALLGMSNNLSMIAMLWGGIGGTITSVAVAALPLLYTGLKALVAEEDHAKEAIDRLNRSLEMQRQGFKFSAIAREALTAAEIKRIHGADNLQSRTEGEAKALEEVNSQIIEQNRLKKERGLEAATGFINEGGLPANDELIKDILAHPAAFKPKGMEFTPEEEARIINQLGLPIPVGGIEGKYKVTRGDEGGAVVFRKAKEDEIATAKKEAKRIGDTIGTLTKEKEKHEENIRGLQKQRDQEAREELDFMKRTASAGFSGYEKAKLDLEKQQKDAERKIRDTFGGIITQPAMTLEEMNKKREQSLLDEQKDLDKNRKDMNALHEHNFLKHGRHLNKQELDDFRQKEEDIKARREAERKKLIEDVQKGPTTVADEMIKANEEIFRRKRMETAQQFTKETGGGFVDIAGLYRQLATAGNGKGIDIAEKTEAHTRDTAKATQDLLMWMQAHPPSGATWQ